ncbi:hypothetical protein NHQ30_010141 [Ciborinia camelliae]|nr:hypothetical protein NHQ30_010141 [Ciborinia camelliae]
MSSTPDQSMTTSGDQVPREQGEDAVVEGGSVDLKIVFYRGKNRFSILKRDDQQSEPEYDAERESQILKLVTGRHHLPHRIFTSSIHIEYSHRTSKSKPIPQTNIETKMSKDVQKYQAGGQPYRNPPRTRYGGINVEDYDGPERGQSPDSYEDNESRTDRNSQPHPNKHRDRPPAYVEDDSDSLWPEDRGRRKSSSTKHHDRPESRGRRRYSKPRSRSHKHRHRSPNFEDPVYSPSPEGRRSPFSFDSDIPPQASYADHTAAQGSYAYDGSNSFDRTQSPPVGSHLPPRLNIRPTYAGSQFPRGRSDQFPPRSDNTNRSFYNLPSRYSSTRYSSPLIYPIIRPVPPRNSSRRSPLGSPHLRSFSPQRSSRRSPSLGSPSIPPLSPRCSSRSAPIPPGLRSFHTPPSTSTNTPPIHYRIVEVEPNSGSSYQSAGYGTYTHTSETVTEFSPQETRTCTTPPPVSPPSQTMPRLSTESANYASYLNYIMQSSGRSTVYKSPQGIFQGIVDWVFEETDDYISRLSKMVDDECMMLNPGSPISLLYEDHQAMGDAAYIVLTRELRRR